MARSADARRGTAAAGLSALASVVFLLLAASPLRAEDAGAKPPSPDASGRPDPCGGIDLVQALKMSDPPGFEKFENSARAIANGQGLLWRIESRAGKVSYLFGTMHSSEPAAKSFDDLVLRARGRPSVVAT